MRGETFVVVVEATYELLVQEMSFAVTFMEVASTVPIAVPVPVEPEPEPEEEVVEEEKVEEKPAATGWDGWKSLLNLSELLPEGVTLPEPNPDPNYVPTPPKPTLSKVTAGG